MRKIFLAIIMLCSSLIFLNGCGSGWSFSGVSAGYNASSTENNFEVTATSLNGVHRRFIDFTAEELENFTVETTNTRGNINLIMIQNNTEVHMSINNFMGFVDTSIFSEGTIEVLIFYDEVRDLHLTMHW